MITMKEKSSSSNSNYLQYSKTAGLSILQLIKLLQTWSQIMPYPFSFNFFFFFYKVMFKDSWILGTYAKNILRPHTKTSNWVDLEWSSGVCTLTLLIPEKYYAKRINPEKHRRFLLTQASSLWTPIPVLCCKVLMSVVTPPAGCQLCFQAT